MKDPSLGLELQLSVSQMQDEPRTCFPLPPPAAGPIFVDTNIKCLSFGSSTCPHHFHLTVVICQSQKLKDFTTHSVPVALFSLGSSNHNNLKPRGCAVQPTVRRCRRVVFEINGVMDQITKQFTIKNCLQKYIFTLQLAHQYLNL